MLLLIANDNQFTLIKLILHYLCAFPPSNSNEDFSVEILSELSPLVEEGAVLVPDKSFHPLLPNSPTCNPTINHGTTYLLYNRVSNQNYLLGDS
jgi:hypothetical protein